jgi:hypothetical protein
MAKINVKKNVHISYQINYLSKRGLNSKKIRKKLKTVMHKVKIPTVKVI